MASLFLWYISNEMDTFKVSPHTYTSSGITNIYCLHSLMVLFAGPWSDTQKNTGVLFWSNWCGKIAPSVLFYSFNTPNGSISAHVCAEKACTGLLQNQLAHICASFLISTLTQEPV